MRLQEIESELVLYRQLQLRWQDRYRPCFETPVFTEEYAGQRVAELEEEREAVTCRLGEIGEIARAR